MSQDQQTILNNSKANMFDGLMDTVNIQTTGITDEIKTIEDRWVRQSNLIYLLENVLATDLQRYQAANELGRLNMDYKKADGYVEVGYWVNDYAQ